MVVVAILKTENVLRGKEDLKVYMRINVVLMGEERIKQLLRCKLISGVVLNGIVYVVNLTDIISTCRYYLITFH